MKPKSKVWLFSVLAALCVPVLAWLGGWDPIVEGAINRGPNTALVFITMLPTGLVAGGFRALAELEQRS